MPELQEIKSEIGGVDFGAHGGSASTTPQPHQNFQWVSDNHVVSLVVIKKKDLTDCPIVWSRQMAVIRKPCRWLGWDDMDTLVLVLFTITRKNVD